MDNLYPITRKQLDFIAVLFNDLGIFSSKGRQEFLLDRVGKSDIDSLSSSEASEVIRELKHQLGKE